MHIAKQSVGGTGIYIIYIYIWSVQMKYLCTDSDNGVGGIKRAGMGDSMLLLKITFV